MIDITLSDVYSTRAILSAQKRALKAIDTNSITARVDTIRVYDTVTKTQEGASNEKTEFLKIISANPEMRIQCDNFSIVQNYMIVRIKSFKNDFAQRRNSLKSFDLKRWLEWEIDVFLSPNFERNSAEAIIWPDIKYFQLQLICEGLLREKKEAAATVEAKIKIFDEGMKGNELQKMALEAKEQAAEVERARKQQVFSEHCAETQKQLEEKQEKLEEQKKQLKEREEQFEQELDKRMDELVEDFRSRKRVKRSTSEEGSSTIKST